MVRRDGRRRDELRPVGFTPGVQKHAEGSVLVATGETQVLCAVSVEGTVPPFRRGLGGWVTAEYAMLPKVDQHPYAAIQRLRRAGEGDPATDRKIPEGGR